MILLLLLLFLLSFIYFKHRVPMEMARKIIQNLYRTSGYKFFLSVLHNLYIVAGKPDEQSYVTFIEVVIFFFV